MPGYRGAIAFALIVLAWGAIPAHPSPSAPPARPSGDPAEAPETPAATPAVGRPAPLFPAPDLSGRPVDVAGLVEGRPALLAFWASWCQPCIDEIPRLRSISRTYGRRGFALVGIGLKEGGETPDKQRQAAAKQLINYQLVFDEGMSYQKAYGMSGLPFNVLVDAEGNVEWIGQLLPDDLEDRVRELIVRSRRKGGTPQG